MTNVNKKTAHKVTAIFSAIQGTYFASIIPYLIYPAVFLQYRGLSNSEIGFSLSAAAVGSIIVQTLVSDFADKNSKVPLKHIVLSIYVIILCLSTALALIPYPISFVMVTFIIGQTCAITLNSLLSATFMQLQNTGLRISFGLPRGVGSITCAVITYLLGLAVEAYTPEILFPIQIGLTILALVCILILPRPENIAGTHPDQTNKKSKPQSLFAMLKGNPTFVVLLIAVVFSSIGQSYFSFLINIIRNAGGNNIDLGIGVCINCGVELIPMIISFWLLKKFGSKKLLIFSIIAFVIKTLFISLASNVSWIYVGLLTSIFANGIFYFASVYFINEIVKPNERTRGQALMGVCSFAGIGLVIGGAIDGVLIDNFGQNAMMIFSIACGLLGITTMFIASHLHKKHFGKKNPILKPEELRDIYQIGI